MTSHAHISRTNFQELAFQLRQEINQGTWADGGRLPLHEELCAQFKVSRTTLSKALNVLAKEGMVMTRKGLGTYLIPKQHREQKQKEEQGHRPPILSLLTNVSTPGIWGTMFNHLNQRARNQGYHLIVYEYEQEFHHFSETLSDFRDKGINGVLWRLLHRPNHQQVNTQIYQTIKDLGLPQLLLDSPLENCPELGYVGCNNYQALSQVTQYILGLGHRRVAFLLDDSNMLFTAQQRMNGFLDTVAAAGLPQEHIYHNLDLTNKLIPNDLRSVGQLIEDSVDYWLNLPEPPTAIICMHDLVAIRVICRLMMLGIKVPEQISVTGFDGLNVLDVFTPKITSYYQNFTQIASNAIDALIYQIEKDPLFVMQREVPGNLIIGQTTAPPHH